MGGIFLPKKNKKNKNSNNNYTIKYGKINILVLIDCKYSF